MSTSQPEIVEAKQPLWMGYLELAAIAGLVLALDQLSKSWVRTTFSLGETWMPWEWLAPYARVVNWHNTGMAFGLFQGGSDLILVLAIGVALLILFYYPSLAKEGWPVRLAIGLQLGGALGNLVDRVRLGHVTDWISVGQFPVFNIADSAVTLGVVILLITLWTDRERPADEAITE